MTNVKITEDILLKELFEIFPESKDVLLSYGYGKIVELDIEDIVIGKLSLRGFFRLAGLEEEKMGGIIREIQSLYNKRLEEM